MVITKLEMRIRAISRWIDVSDAGGVGIDALIRQVHDERVRKVRSNRFGDVVREQTKRFHGNSVLM